MRTVLVTGGTGYIGSHTCFYLMEQGYKVIVIDSLVNSSVKSLERIKDILKKNNNRDLISLEFFEGSLNNKEFVDYVFHQALNKGNKIDAVIHFAGFKSVKESVQNPYLYWQNNVIGTINLVSVMNKYICNKIVFSSSATIYNANNIDLISEKNEIGPINPYGNTKRANEIFLSDIYKSDKQKWGVINLRYFNPIGAHPSGLIGESPKGIPNNIFPIIMNIAFEKKQSLEVFGKDWPTKDGTCIRDYIHITDLAKGHIKALEFMKKKDSTNLCINLGTGKGTSVLELIRIFEDTNKLKLNYNFSSRRDGDAPIVVADNSLAKKILNWVPEKSISEMCKDGWNWKLKNPNGY
ncbi:UDP-glucose 4-epimerase GalE [Prochlorococcus marinus str. XMU1401]|uniref:UDP-glucose 4-epimerase n=1 Tax=Prochlorococcus marinus str. XMU1401 TaxID=2052594 RepID=A0A8I1X4C4_PROMR|nr:UDP-glucose 4-epimerase GalE [Prochlorococcus marinus]MBO8223274.1 UDP-glucose 4-epimerase GalE [Prochlorococcus marinus str. XMU1401]MBW3059806.1 UDP-glucose 4-epimerase GalE [Prochlorococcus marinus str. XMU1401E]MCQ9198968.1 UDP-glucose 4-epimerase GalE [Prochlorococcus marinus XMU1429]PJC83677.1 UDP-glucose 4-epimerase GalE [Prochlorococcus marinus str. XMU1401]